MSRAWACKSSWSPPHLSEFPAVPFTFVPQVRPAPFVLFQLGSVLSCFPVDRYLPRFDGKILPLLRSTRLFEGGDLMIQAMFALLIRSDRCF